MCDFTFVSDIGPCQRIVSCDHYTCDISCFQILNRIESFLFQFVFKNFKAIKLQITLSILSLDVFWVFSYLFRGHGKNSESSWCILLENFMIIIGNGWFVHDLEHNFRGSLAITECSTSSDTVWCDDAHSLNIRVELKPPENHTFVVSFAWKWKDNVWIVLRKIKFKLTKLK